MMTGFCATDERSAITGGNACRPDRSREAVKRPGFTGLAPTAPEVNNLCIGHFGYDQIAALFSGAGVGK